MHTHWFIINNIINKLNNTLLKLCHHKLRLEERIRTRTSLNKSRSSPTTVSTSSTNVPSPTRMVSSDLCFPLRLTFFFWIWLMTNTCFLLWIEYMKILQACAMGFVVIGFIGYIIKLVFIPINNIILGAWFQSDKVKEKWQAHLSVHKLCSVIDVVSSVYSQAVHLKIYIYHD